MAVDTIRIRSPYIDEVTAKALEMECNARIGIECRTGNLLYEIVTGDLKGSFDSRIAINIKRKRYVTSKDIRGKQVTSLEDCKPYIEIECSLHKLMLGHNIFGGSDDFNSLVAYLIDFIQVELDITLPKYDLWTVLRIDFAYVFDLKDVKAVEEFFYLQKNSYYPRRSVDTYGLSGIYASASTTSLKFYHKGPEFKKNDMKRLISTGSFTEEKAFTLYQEANKILRVEIGIKRKKLIYDFKKIRRGHEPYVKDVTAEYLHNLYAVEVDRFLKEGKRNSDITRNNLEVEERLYTKYKSRLAGTLFSVWNIISVMGIDHYKRRTAKRTYYRQIKQLKDAGISWNRTDIEELEEYRYLKLDKDFIPLIDNKYRLIETDQTIIEKLNDVKIKRSFTKEQSLMETS